MDNKLNQIKKDSQETITSLVTKADIKRVYDRLDDFARFSDLTKFQEELRPVMNDCRTDLTLYATEHAQMKEMIRRFDECLAEKANKMTLVELEKRIQDNFLNIKQWDAL